MITTLLKQAYSMYKVANGTMESLVMAHDGNTRPLQRRLEEFFEPWVLNWDFDKSSMTLERAMDGITYLPMTINSTGHQGHSSSNGNSNNKSGSSPGSNRTTATGTAVLSNLDRLVKSVVQDKYKGWITHSMVLFEDQLVASDIREQDLRAVWRHVVHLTGYDGYSDSAQSAWDRKEEEEARKRKVWEEQEKQPSRQGVRRE